jgi:hypothetical protein
VWVRVYRFACSRSAGTGAHTAAIAAVKPVEPSITIKAAAPAAKTMETSMMKALGKRLIW